MKWTAILEPGVQGGTGSLRRWRQFAKAGTVPELAKPFGASPTQINKWKREFIENAARAFSNGEAAKSDASGVW